MQSEGQKNNCELDSIAFSMTEHFDNLCHHQQKRA